MPTPQEARLIGEVNAASGAWWDARKGHETIQDFTEHLVTTGRATLRYFVPAGLLNEAGSLNTTDWEKALDSIYWKRPRPAVQR